MTILFFCGSLEPGRDGVGDYTLCLAGAVAARGHTCAVIALHDPFVQRTSDQTPGDIRLIRLSASEPWPERLAHARQQLGRIAPDWVSWQFVAQGLQPRGFLPAALLRAAPGLRGPRCHVMLHELWLGLESGAGLRSRAVGFLQRRGIVCLLNQLDPECVHTSNPAYQSALKREGWDAGVLKLFGNVPIADDCNGDRTPLARWLPSHALRDIAQGTSRRGPGDPTHATPFVALTFGTLHPQWNPDATVDWLIATARRRGRPPALVAVGRTGSHAARILDAFRNRGVTVAATGELDATAVSHLLSAADLGIAPHPWALIGKSGAAASMLEHGLPVLVPRDDWYLRRGPALPSGEHDPLLMRLAGLDAARTDLWLSTRRAPQSGVNETSDALLEAFDCAAPHALASNP